MMTDQELMNEILQGKDHGRLIRALDCLLRNSDRFRDFLVTYLDKIKKKVKDAKRPQELDDLVFELETGYSLGLDKQSTIEYEKYGKGKMRTPDYAVNFRGKWDFNVEVRHLQEAQLGKEFDRVTEAVEAQLPSLPKGFILSLYMPSDWRDLDESRTKIEEAQENRDFVQRFIDAEPAVIESIKEIIEEYERAGISEHKYYPIRGFEDEIELLIAKSSSAPDAETILASRSRPRFYINTENRKICEAICQKLGQMLPGMINILVIRSSSTTFHKRNFTDAIDLINEMVEAGDDAFFIKNGLAGVQDYQEKVKNLGGILFKSGNKITQDGWEDEPCLFWSNDAAEVTIPEEVQDFFRTVVSTFPSC